ncbi:hypothetical protein NDU88_006395 [Pleurodeles waltl]|uniref:Uncharacterized protein n=1 Tax=Pleurodeles waltl TaxID=8319 RepID=A0AAV7WXH3_PLEWA|nr:hypothetical protein NDU88_006395 [Pleurodeles waltl]
MLTAQMMLVGALCDCGPRVLSQQCIRPEQRSGLCPLTLQGGLSPSRPPASGPACLQALTRCGPGGPRLIPAARPAQLLQGRTDPAGRVSIRLPGVTHAGRTVPRPAQQGPVGLERSARHGSPGGTPPALRPALPFTARCTVQAGKGPPLQAQAAISPSRPRQFNGHRLHRIKDSLVRASGSRRSSGRGRQPAPRRRTRPPARISQALSRVAQQGSAGTERSAQLTSPGGKASSTAAHAPGCPSHIGREELRWGWQASVPGLTPFEELACFPPPSVTSPLLLRLLLPPLALSRRRSEL